MERATKIRRAANVPLAKYGKAAPLIAHIRHLECNRQIIDLNGLAIQIERIVLGSAVMEQLKRREDVEGSGS
jgi:hypothetical protein